MDEYPIPDPPSEWVITEGVLLINLGISWAKLTLANSFFVIFINETGVCSEALNALTVTSSRVCIANKVSIF